MFAIARVLVNALVLDILLTVHLTCPEMAVSVRGNAADVYSKQKTKVLLLCGASPRRLARAIAQIMVRIRTLAPQPSKF